MTAVGGDIGLAEGIAPFADSFAFDATCLLDSDGRLEHWNPGAERSFGWKSEEMLGESCARLFGSGGSGRKAARDVFARVSEFGTFREARTMYRRDGAPVSCLVDIAPMAGRKGYRFSAIELGKWSGGVRANNEENAQIRSILDTVPVAMIVIDEDGLVRSFSAAAAAMFGYDTAEVIGSNVSVLMPHAEAERHDGHLERYRRTGEKHAIGSVRRVVGQRRDGTTFPLTLTVGEVGGGDERAFAAIMRDLTESEETDAKLRALEGELARKARISAVGTLAGALAHELNQPLSAIANYIEACAELLRRQEGSGSADSLPAILDRAGREAVRAGEIVRRLRQFVVRGELERSAVCPAELTRQACALAAVDATSRAIECHTTIEGTPPMILADSIQIQQVLHNLLRNAIEAIEADGHIHIQVATNHDVVMFTVRDDGPGLEPGHDIFDPFSSSKSAGMGLGLSICQTIVRAHGGRLWHSRNADGGMSFHFTVPAVPPDRDDG